MSTTSHPKLFLKIFFQKESKRLGSWIFLLLILQQLLAASSSFWITQFAKTIQNESNWKLPLILFLCSMILPYVPGALALHFTNLWTFLLHKLCTTSYLQYLENRIDIVNNEKLKHTHTSLVSKEIPQFIQDAVPFMLQFISQILNLLFQLLAVSFILGPIYLWAFFAGIMLVYALLTFSKRTNEILSKCKQNSMTEVGVILGSCWNNVTIANSYNLNLWQANLEKAMENFRKYNSELSLHKEFGGALFSLLGVLPFVFYLGIHFLTNTPPLSELITLSVLLPRIFQLFNVGTSVSILTKNIGTLVGRWQAIEGNIIMLQHEVMPFENRIKNHDIQIYDNMSSRTVTPLAIGKNDLLNRNGYFTLTGPNGAGKSSLLQRLKKDLKGEAMYIPPTADLTFVGCENQVLSTGQKVRQALDEAFNLPADIRPKVFLLDEWDANLDQTTHKIILDKIWELSESHLIVEICHKQPVGCKIIS